MERIRRFCSILLVMVLCMGLPLHAQSYEKLWKQVEQAQKKSLPQTVVKLTDEIYRKGEREQNAPQMLKAYICREASQKQLTPDSLITNLKRLERWVQSEKNAVNKAILHSLLAREYADLMWNNRQTLMQRTALDMDEAPQNVMEWSISQFVNAIDEHNRASLQDSIGLLHISTRKYVPFTVLKDGSRFYQHDMYHLLASRAIAAYTDLAAFNVDSLAHLRINDIYQNQINAYRNSAGMEDATVLCLLNYWKWKINSDAGRVSNETFHERREQMNKEYLRTLDALIQEYGSREVCVEVYISKVQALQTSGNNHTAEALRVCDEGLKRYSAYKRIGELKNIRENILRSVLRVEAPRSAYPGDSLRLNVNYRHLNGFTVILYRTDLSEVSRDGDGLGKGFYSKHARKLSTVHFALKPLPKVGVDLENLPYQYCDTIFKIQVPDSVGVYAMQVIPDGTPGSVVDNLFVSTRFKVLTLGLPGNKTELITLDARSGQPIADAKISFYASEDAKKSGKVLFEATTNNEGKVIVDHTMRSISYVAHKGADKAMLLQRFYQSGYYGREDSRPQQKVTLLTDRSLYRPGQTIYVKGIAYEQAADTAHVLAGETYQMVLLDANRKQLAQKEVRTNEFGSFTTEFALPAMGLNGNFTVEVKNKSTVTVRVEEYKRPTFDITFNPVKQAYKLGETVNVTGNVKSYSGVAVQNLPLKYTITRSTPWMRERMAGNEPLASDTVQVNANGDFSIPVVLHPGSAGQWRADSYVYTIEAVVTEDAGETQATTYRLMASEHAYNFEVGIPTELCKEDSIVADFSIENANRQLLNIEGVYRLYPIVNIKTGQIAEKPVFEGTFISHERKNLSEWRKLPSGKYRLILSVQDSEGKEVNNAKRNPSDILLFSLSDTRPAVFIDNFLYEENTKFDKTHPAIFYYGTSFKNTYLLIDVFGRNGRLESRAMTLNDSIIRMEYPYKEEYGDGISIQFTFVKQGQAYTRRVELQKRLPEKTLDMKWEVFRDGLRPGQQEEWKLVIKTPQGFPAVAEMLATMYDASLDKIYKQNQSLGVYFNRYIPFFYWNESNIPSALYAPYMPKKSWKVHEWEFDYFWHPSNAVVESFGGNMLQIRGVAGMNGNSSRLTLADALNTRILAKESKEESGKKVELNSALVNVMFGEEVIVMEEEVLQPMTELRTNFSETAFFYPQLRTNDKGEVAFSFVVPQSLTRWNFRGYSHTKDMMTGMLDATTVTAKEFMLTPNMPRFVRVGDKTQIAGSIANLTDKAVQGTATLALFDPMTEKVILTRNLKFAVEAGKTTAINFYFDVSDRLDVLGVRMIADGGTFSDGEQHLLPVLSNQEYITETLAMPIRGEQTRTFSLDSLFNSRTATDRRLTVEFTGNPTWYAIQALPALSLPASDNALSWATSYYANSVAEYIVNSQPRIKTVFDSWKLVGGTKETFLSRLEKNQDVKNILLNESPWLLEATTEAEQQARIATLFDVNLLNGRNLSAYTKLKGLQGANGAWSWYKGMSGSRYITSYITELLIRLPLLTQKALPTEVADMKQKAFGYLHQASLEEYRMIRKAEKNGAKITTLSDEVMKYLYLVALSGEKIPATNQDAQRYFLSMISRNLENGTMVRKAQSSVILKVANRTTEANEFIASIKEHLVQTDEMGAHFAFSGNIFSWGMMPISVHVEAMEALRMAGGNEALLEEMKLWLLKQKQTTSWNTPVATADAIYALLCQGSNLLENRGDVRITIGKKVMETFSSAKTTVPGLGYIKESFSQSSPVLKAKSITVQKRDAGIAWGAVYAQYLSPISDVKQQGAELNVEKKLFVERMAANGQKSLQPITDVSQLSIGDKVVSRLTISLDRPMDFVQLKDQRGACFEPVGALSGYRWNAGIGYYVEVEDAATNFFFDHLGKGVYVLEHSYRIARGGTYEAGLATIQCAYAPEFVSHSAGSTVVIK